ncbi:conserved hypothetical protein [Vibrio nigripulchritudo SOn1]|uniref:VTT domain-containing protein n=2 Tax=Vibrio nigripulchritudo TaxID=28173 RepID=A0AAV2VL80_9VIBR|nr:DedA family protein [Vibrio nigripulchritudo]CCO45388.1 conserved hypothetical protein [Vibrio nigripulchritudo SOn1]
MAEYAQQFNLWASQQTLLSLMLGIVLISYLLEDLAILGAAGLATQDAMPTSMALLAIFIGIATGDLGLYYLGKWAQRSRWLRYRLLSHKSMRWVRNKLHTRPIFNLFIIRFIPGLRTLGYSLSGFFQLPQVSFMAAVLFATALWTALIFGCTFWLGQQAWIQASSHQWLLVPVLFITLITGNRLMKSRFSGRIQ